MIIEKDRVVAITYTLKGVDGEILDSSDGSNPLEYVHGNKNIIPGLETALEGKKAGDSIKAEIEPKDAYGEYRQDLVITVPKSNFPSDADIEEGMQFEAESPEGNSVVTVVKVDKEMITVDANHPLAGEKLFFDVAIANVREATADELKNGLEQGCGCGGGCGDGCDCDEECGDDCSCGDHAEGGCCGGHH